MASRSDYQKKATEKLNAMKSEIKEFKAAAEKAKAEANRQINRDMVLLRQKQTALQGHLRALRQSGDEAWVDVKKGLDLAWKDMSVALKAAKKRFG